MSGLVGWVTSNPACYAGLSYSTPSAYGKCGLVSQSHVEQVQRYILNQEMHHRKKTFKDEFRSFLKKYEVDYDERYVWA
jgi:hypothetical protein